MTAIRIIKAPSGEVPKRVRQTWVGLILPTHGEVSESRRIKSGNPAPGGYLVNPWVAIAVLESHRKFQAAQWWQKYFLRWGVPSNLVFDKDACEVIA